MKHPEPSAIRSRSLLVFAFLFFSGLFFLQAQQDFIQGRLLDSGSGEPVVFATLRLKGLSLGVISDQDGYFRLPLEYREQGSELEISCMGYETLVISFDDLNEQSINTIRVKAVAFELAESVVTAKRKALNAKTIVRYALNNIPTNYPTSPFGLVGYYRDYQRQDKQYINLNEAIIEVMDKGFQTVDPLLTEFLLYEYKQNRSFRIDSFAAKPYDYIERDKVAIEAEVPSYGGNELMLLRVHNAIRNHRINTYSFVNRIKEDFMSSHVFSISGRTYYNGRRVYEITAFYETVQYRAIGKLFIDEQSFAIRKMEYAVERILRYRQNESGAVNNVMSANNPNTSNAKKTELMYRIEVEYRESGEQPKGKLYLNYISFENRFRLTRPAEFRIEDLLVDLGKREIEVYLNKDPKEVEKLDRSSFQVTYNGKKVPVEKLIYDKDKKMARLLVAENKLRKTHIQLLFDPRNRRARKTLRVFGRKLEDQEGNRLAERKSELIKQFREFFTQDIVPYREGVRPREMMDRETPLFDSEQPLFPAKNATRYWMNTPLREVGG